MQKIALGAAFAVLSLALPGAAQAQKAPNAVIVVVDTDRIYRECTACVAAQGQLQTMGTQLQQQAQQLGQPLQQEAQSIEQAAAALRNQTGSARTTAETALQTRVQQLRQRETGVSQQLVQAEQNLRSTQAHVLQQINTRLNPLISQVMAARGANIAVDVSATLAHANAVNVTDQVLAQLNASLPTVSVTPLAQPAQPQAQPAQPTR